ncbi:MAG: hypothetical protein ACREC0_05780 [Methylocella sp.]
MREHRDRARGLTCFTDGKFVRAVNLAALEKIYVNNRRLMQTHETVTKFRKESLGSNRKFGRTFDVLFAILSLWPLFHQAGSPKWGLIALSAAILAVALLCPHWRMPLSRGWFKLGLALNRIAGPAVMAILFSGQPSRLAGICAGRARIFRVLK